MLYLAKGRRELLRYLRRGQRCPPFRVTINCMPLGYARLHSVEYQRARMANVAIPSPHSFRQAFCVGMLPGGADIVSRSRLMGHPNLSLLMRYAKQAQENLHLGAVDILLYDLGAVHHGPGQRAPLAHSVLARLCWAVPAHFSTADISVSTTRPSSST